MSDSQSLYFITGNQTKVLHAQTVMDEFAIQLVQHPLSLIEPRAEDPAQVVLAKAEQAFSQVGQALIVEDSGIFIPALNGFPKTFVHFVTDTIGISGILKLMAGVSDRRVEFHQSLALIAPGFSAPQVFNYVDGGYTLAEKIWEPTHSVSADFDKILIPPGASEPLCMFSREWRAQRDASANPDIHYRQLGRWLTAHPLP